MAMESLSVRISTAIRSFLWEYQLLNPSPEGLFVLSQEIALRMAVFPLSDGPVIAFTPAEKSIFVSLWLWNPSIPIDRSIRHSLYQVSIP